jgi:hypothetical protein
MAPKGVLRRSTVSDYYDTLKPVFCGVVAMTHLWFFQTAAQRCVA